LYQGTAKAAIAIALEEAAKVADEYATDWWGHTEQEHAGQALGAAIRALKEKTP
jgi:predicted transcriptional regulator